MIIGYFYIYCILTVPCKTDTPFLIDSDTELSFPVAAKRLEAVAGVEHN